MSAPPASVDGILARFGPMGDVAAAIWNYHNALLSEKDDLKRWLDSSVAPQWDGRASVSWQTFTADWDDAFDSLLAVLRDLNNALEASLGNYQLVENAAERMWEL